jgi:hypothetical protein
MVFGPIVLIQHQQLDLGKAWAQERAPQVTRAIHDKVTGDLGRAQVQKQVVILGQQEAPRGQGGRGLEIMVRRSDLNPADAAPREIANLDGCFGIHREAQHLVGLVRRGID